ncbi:hypothetical protein F4821DRAFT_85248 [Hypoxylon rubiginosum]|uniref:Uncharacterized protein n=1 Tax=Hypoxylon rubiginosum TaxID=110542 RepID=A0ACC0D7Q5_9PEZI|nr:hypothetical protein F4821DRAFT_85248 [Hypoxylon rubiginosum]
MVGRVLILAGAPQCDKLDWKDSGLLNHFIEPIAKFSSPDTSIGPEDVSTIRGTALDVALWRSIPLHRTTLHTGFSQLHQVREDYHGYDGFFAALPASIDSTSALTRANRSSQEILDQFYDHTLAAHDIPSSQLPTLSFSTDGSLSTTEETSIRDSLRSTSSSAYLENPITPHSIHLSDLEDLPKAQYLQSITPQTMTVNLVVGIISIAEPRTVKTRWGSTKSLIELLVGDETKSGFTVTFWLSSGPNEPSSEILRELRRQDIVLLRNVALSVFMKKVHGHSLRKGLTKVDLLHRRRLDKNDRGGLYNVKDVSSKKSAHAQLMKTRKVREWVMNFVGGGDTALGKRKHKGKAVRSWDMPPDDTQ